MCGRLAHLLHEIRDYALQETNKFLTFRRICQAALYRPLMNASPRLVACQSRPSDRAPFFQS